MEPAPAYVHSGRQARPLMMVMLVLMIITAILGVVCIGMGAKIGDDLSTAKSYGSAFWWGGLVILILGGLYIPCHFLVMSGNQSGRALFFAWTFFVVIGVICILISALLSGLVYAFISGVQAGHCTYINDTGSFVGGNCNQQCRNYFNSGLTRRTCCCCFYDDPNDNTIVYIKDVSSCEVFKTSKELARGLTIIYVISVILLFILMVLAYVIACGCCAVQQPWVVGYTAVTTTTTAPAYGSTGGGKY